MLETRNGRALAASAGSGPEDAARSRKPLLQREGRPGVAGEWRTGGTATDRASGIPRLCINPLAGKVC